MHAHACVSRWRFPLPRTFRQLCRGDLARRVRCHTGVELSMNSRSLRQLTVAGKGANPAPQVRSLAVCDVIRFVHTEKWFECFRSDVVARVAAHGSDIGTRLLYPIIA